MGDDGNVHHLGDCISGGAILLQEKFLTEPSGITQSASIFYRIGIHDLLTSYLSIYNLEDF